MNYMHIPYNPANDPKALFAQGIQNMISGILYGQQRKRQIGDIRDVGQYIAGGFEGETPSPITQFGQELLSRALLGRPKPTLSPIGKMISEGLLTKEEGQKLARRESQDQLTEKDIISIMHTLERAMAATHDAAGFPLEGPEYAGHRKYYAEQLEHYKALLQRRRSEKEKPPPPPPPEKPEEVLGGKTVSSQDLKIWKQLDEETKKLVARAVMRGHKKPEIIAALKARGAIK